MEDEYTISAGYKAFYSILAAVLLLFALWAASKWTAAQPEAFMLIPLMLIALATLFILNALRRKVVIYDDSIEVTGVFTKKQLDFKDVRGCRVGQKHIEIEPVSAEYPTLRIVAYNDFSGSKEMADFLKGKFPDLDTVDLENERKEFLQDASLGATEAERETKLKTARTIAIIYAVGGWLIFIMGIFGGKIFFKIAAMVYPLMGIVLMLTSKGIIKFITNIKASVYPNITYGFMPSAILLLIAGISDYNMFSSANLWAPFLIALAIMATAIYFADRVRIVEKIRGKIVLILLLSAAYSYGLIWSGNCIFDRSAARIYKTVVLDHRIEHGKHTSYYLTIAPWGPQQNQTDIDAGSWMYYNVPIGDIVKVTLRQGLLHIPWYVVTKF